MILWLLETRHLLVDVTSSIAREGDMVDSLMTRWLVDVVDAVDVRAFLVKIDLRAHCRSFSL